MGMGRMLLKLIDKKDIALFFCCQVVLYIPKFSSELFSLGAFSSCGLLKLWYFTCKISFCWIFICQFVHSFHSSFVSLFVYLFVWLVGFLACFLYCLFFYLLQLFSCSWRAIAFPGLFINYRAFQCSKAPYISHNIICWHNPSRFIQNQHVLSQVRKNPIVSTRSLFAIFLY